MVDFDHPMRFRLFIKAAAEAEAETEAEAEEEAAFTSIEHRARVRIQGLVMMTV